MKRKACHTIYSSMNKERFTAGKETLSLVGSEGPLISIISIKRLGIILDW